MPEEFFGRLSKILNVVTVYTEKGAEVISTLRISTESGTKSLLFRGVVYPDSLGHMMHYKATREGEQILTDTISGVIYRIENRKKKS